MTADKPCTSRHREVRDTAVGTTAFAMPQVRIAEIIVIAGALPSQWTRASYLDRYAGLLMRSEFRNSCRTCEGSAVAPGQYRIEG